MQDTRGTISPAPKRPLFPVLVVLLTLAVVWGIPEILVRWTNPELDRYTAILFGQDPMSPHLFVRDPDLAWSLRPVTAVRFLGADVRTNRQGWRGEDVPEGGTKILCLGDSTTFGWRVREADAFPARLQALLASPDPDGERRVVIGAAVPGYSSLQVRRLAERAIPRWRPAVVVLCTGNNDGWPSAESDAAYFRRTRATAAVERVVARSRWLVWLRNRLAPDPPSIPVADVLAPGLTPRVSREEFLDNVGAIVAAARAAGARPIVLAPPANVYEHPVRPMLPGDQKRRLDRNESILALASTGRAEEALRLAESLAARDPSDFQAPWLRGIALLNLGRIDEGRRALDEALEAHPAPASLKPSWRRDLARLAAEQGIDYLDANTVIEAAIGRERPADLFLDWCHPTPLGHERIAAALAERIALRRTRSTPEAAGVSAARTAPAARWRPEAESASPRIRPG